MTEKKKKWLKIGAICAAVLLVGNFVFSGIVLINQIRINAVYNDYFGEGQDPAQEDDVEIAGEYMIKSTLPISDAYKSGDTSKLSDSDKETLDMAKEVIDEVITEEMTPFEKELAIYQFLIRGMKNSTGILTVINTGVGEYYTPHDVLKYRSAVCVGYATTFRMFMQMLDIDCMVVHSTGLGHSWDLVKLDGEWYHTDCYMDSDTSGFENFNMTDEECANMGHEWNQDFFPAADGNKFNYMLSVAEEIKDIYAVPKWVMEAVKEKKTAISCTFKKEITKDDEDLALYLVNEVQNNLENTDKFDASHKWMQNDVGQYVLCFYFQYIENVGDSLDEETRQKIDEKVYNTFEKYGFYDHEDDNY